MKRATAQNYFTNVVSPADQPCSELHDEDSHVTPSNWKAESEKFQTARPWLDAFGEPLPLDELKKVSQHWNSEQWESYLTTIEVGQRECQAIPEEVETLGLGFSVFELSQQSASEDLQILVNRLLETLTSRQREIINKIFFERLSERQVAKSLMISRQGVCDLKRRALRKLIKTAPKVLANFTYSIGTSTPKSGIGSSPKILTRATSAKFRSHSKVRR